MDKIPKETTALQLGESQSTEVMNSDTFAGGLSDAPQLIENIIKGLQYLIEHIEFLVLSEYWEQEMIVILSLAEELDAKLETIAERMENSLNGETLTQ